MSVEIWILNRVLLQMSIRYQPPTLFLFVSSYYENQMRVSEAPMLTRRFIQPLFEDSLTFYILSSRDFY